MITIHPIEPPVSGLEDLRAEALREGFLFVDRLWKEWESGTNRFAAPGECLLGCVDGATLVAIGGLNHDPFEDGRRTGRIRRVYVRAAWRGRGIGEALVRALVERAQTSFMTLHLRTENPAAARLYERIGFTRFADLNATHVLNLSHPSS